MQYYITDSFTVLLLTLAAVIASILLIIFYRGRIRDVGAAGNKPSNRSDKYSAETYNSSQRPPVSIIVYDKDNSHALEQIINDIYAQDYDGQFEIIIASDGNSPASTDVVKRASATHSNLRMTFVPDHSQALSPKKLAITLGVKGAKYDNIIVTDASCRILSTHWLAEFAKQFADGATLIIGFASPALTSDNTLGAMQRFDLLADAVTYLPEARSGRPYRGLTANMGFTRQLFNEHKGYSNSVAYHHGEDDIFVETVAGNATVSTLLTPDSMLILTAHNHKGNYRYEKLSHLFTGRYVSHRGPRTMGMYSLLMWIWLGCTVASFILSYPSWIAPAIALVSGIAWISVSIFAWRVASKRLNIRLTTAMLPVTMFLRPMYNTIYRLKVMMNKDIFRCWVKNR